MHPTTSKIGGLPIELWNEILGYLKQRDAHTLRQVCKETGAELDTLRPKMDADTWKKKLAKIERLRLKVYADATPINDLAKKIDAWPSFDPRNAEDSQKLKEVNKELADLDQVCREGVKQARDKIQNWISKKTLTIQQGNDLKKLTESLALAEKTYISQIKKVSNSLQHKAGH